MGPDPAKFIRAHLRNKPLLYISEPTAKQLFDLPVCQTPERFDYLYDLPALRALEGGKYLKKRTIIHKCQRSNPQVVQLDSSMAGECCALLQRWMESPDRPGLSSALDEISSLRLAMEHFDALKLTGVALTVAGQMEAFAIGAPVNETMFVEHFEHATDALPGLYPLVMHEFAKAVPAQYTILNKEEDLGLPGLKMAKDSWHPMGFVKKYSID